jgi:cytochrome b561
MRKLRPYTRQFSATAKWLHWLVAFFLLSIIGVAWQFPFIAPEDRAGAIPVHVSIGLIVLTLTLMRLIWRQFSPPPPPPEDTPAWVVKGAWFGHRALYGLLLIQGVLGLMLAALSPADIRFFNTWNLSALASADTAMLQVLRPLHLLVAILLTLTIIGHVLGAIWHHFVLRDDVLQRMLPFGGLWQRLVTEERNANRRFPSRRFANWPKRWRFDENQQ